jgi:putative transposase
MLTPHDVHHGLAEMRHAHRAVVLQSAYAAHPERFVKQLPMPPTLPTAAWINKPADKPDNLPQPLMLTEGIAL